MSNEVRASKPIVRRATQQDCIELSKTLRKADRQEIEHACGLPPQPALLHGLAVSNVAHVVTLDDAPVLIFGVTGVAGQWGSPWMLATDRLQEIRRPFVRECRQYLQEMLDEYKHLANYVWARNVVHIEWLKWLGFEMKPAVPFGVSGQPFHYFSMKG